MKEKILSVIILILILAASPLCASTAADVKRGNLLYNSKKYDEAIKAYDSALEKRGDNGMLRFNKGDALYRKESFNAAIESFNLCLASGSKRILPDVDYNIGNSYYRIGAAHAKTDYNKTKDAYETAMQFYKRAIDLNPDDKNAKYNYEFVEERLLSLKEKSEKEKKKQENQEQNKQQDKKDQPSQNKGGQDGEGSKGQDKQRQDQQQNQQKQKSKTQDEEKQQGQQQQNQQQQAGQHKEEGVNGQEQTREKDQEEKDKKEEKKQGVQPKSEGEEIMEEKKQKDEERRKSERRAKDQQEKEKPQPQPQAEGEKDQQGIQFYQQAKGEPRQMSEEEAKMLLEGYKGEEATGQTVRMRRKQVPFSEPEKNW